MLKIVCLNNNELDLINNNINFKKRRISNHHIIHTLSCLIKNYNWSLCSYELLYNNKDNIEQFFLNKFNEIPKYFIIFDHSLEILEIKFPKKTNILNICVDTIFGRSKNVYKTKCWNKCDAVFSTYGYNIQKKMPRVKSTHIVYLPHSIYYKCEFNENPINKIFVGGHIKNYPPREYLNKLSNTKDFKNKIDCFKPKCGRYSFTPKNKKNYIVGQDFINKMNNYIACFTDDVIGMDKKLIEECGGNGYIVAKHFEILASGSLLVSFNERTKDMFKLIGFIDGIHYISVNYDNINDKINFILDIKNRHEIDKIRKNGYDLSLKNHNYIERAKYINQWAVDKSKLDLSLKFNLRYNTHFILGY
jgi:hypothetical protein